MRRARQGAAGGTCSGSSGACANPATSTLNALRSYRLLSGDAKPRLSASVIKQSRSTHACGKEHHYQHQKARVPQPAGALPSRPSSEPRSANHEFS